MMSIPVPATVIVLHGLARTARSMASMARFLAGQGYRVDNVDYPSRQAPIEVLADHAIAPAMERARAAGAREIHFVTHSLGGILVRAYQHAHPTVRLNRVVMLCPPNGGSDVVDHYHARASRLGRFLKEFFGPASFQLRTDGLTSRLGGACFELGVVAGTLNRHPLWGPLFADRESDGTVPLERTKLEGMTDFLAVPYTHTFIMNKPEVQSQVAHFLAHGSFRRVPEPATS